MDEKIFKLRQLNKLELFQYMEFEPFKEFYNIYLDILNPKYGLEIKDFETFYFEVLKLSYIKYDNEQIQLKLYPKFISNQLKNCEIDFILYEIAKLELAESIFKIISFSTDIVSHYENLDTFSFHVSIEKPELNISEFVDDLTLKLKLLTTVLNKSKAIDYNSVLTKFNNRLFETIIKSSNALVKYKDWINTNVLTDLITKDLPVTNLNWQGSQTDLAEVLKALILNGNIKGTQKELFAVISKVLNFKIDETESIKSLRRRNNGSETKILDELKRSYIQNITK